MVQEIVKAPSYKTNSLLLIMKFIGICNVDTLFPGDADPTTLTEDEVGSFFLTATDFSFDQCRIYYAKSILALILEGFIFRLLAGLALHFLNRSKKGL